MNDRSKRRWARRQWLLGGHGGWRSLIGFAWVAIAMTAVFAVGLAWLSRVVVQQRTLTLYTTQDLAYAAGIVGQFEQETGIRVQVLYASEADKTVGGSRMLADRELAHCDVFWNNALLLTRQLALSGTYRETNAWAEFGYRSRRLVINTNRVEWERAPRSLLELTNRHWRGKVAIAYPRSGTTATHFLALRQHWGKAGWQEWCLGLRDNEPFMLDGNSDVVQLVGRGDAWIGTTDSDDLAVGQRAGLPVAALPLSEEMMLIPNTVGVMRDSLHPVAAEQFFQFVQRPDVVEQLVAWQALEGASTGGATHPTLNPDWNRLMAELEQATSELQSIFVR